MVLDDDNKKLFRMIIVFVCLAIIAFFLKINFVSLTPTSDYTTYIETAKFFSGTSESNIYDYRILKPLQPLVTAFLNIFTKNFDQAFMFQVFIFYLLITVVSVVFFREFFNRDRFLTAAGAAMFLFSFPMLGFGLNLFTETGGWFFYLLALFLTLKFLKKPSEKLVWVNSIVSTLGFLYKEYSIVGYIIANLAIFFAPNLEKEKRIKYFAILNGVFIAVNIFWQAIVYLKYGYTYFDWYIEGGLTGAPAVYNFWFIKRSFFAILLLGWAFVPAALLSINKLDSINKKFLYLLITVPFICLLWGGVSSRLFYVTAPGLIILSILGIDRVLRNIFLKYILLATIILVNILFLVKGSVYTL